MPPSLPPTVHLAGRTYQIVLTPIEDAVGQCVNDQLQIQLSPGQHPIEERDAALHEVLHALIYIFNIHFRTYKAEEAVVRPLATALLGTLLDNPEFTQWLINPPQQKSQS